jgi:hypothetical protein
MRTWHPAGINYLRTRREPEELLVLAALRAACERLGRVLRCAADLACLESARCDAPERASFFSARSLACERLLDGRLRSDER